MAVRTAAREAIGARPRERAVIGARSLLLAAAATLALALGDKAEAAVSWNPPELIYPDLHQLGDLAAAAGPSNYAVVAWIRGHVRHGGGDPFAPFTGRVLVNVRPPGEDAFGGPTPLTGRQAVSVEVGVSDTGDTVLSWANRQGTIRARFRSSGTGWSRPQVVSAPTGRSDGREPVLAVGPDGSAVEVWSVDGPDRLKVAVRDPGEGFGNPHTLANDFSGRFAAALSEGRMAVAWASFCVSGVDPAAMRVSVAFRHEEGRFSSPHLVRRSACPNEQLALGLDDRGSAAVMISGHYFRQLVKASYRIPGEGFTPASEIDGQGRANSAEIGMSGDGRAIAIWSPIRQNGPIAPGVTGVAAAYKPPTGEFGVPERISNRFAGGMHDLAVAPAGGGLAVWRSERSYRLQAAFTDPAASSFGVPTRISPPLNPHTLTQAQAALSPTGEGLVAWMDTDDDTLDDHTKFSVSVAAGELVP